MVETRILETKIDNIFAFDKKVRAVALLTADGDPIAEFSRPGFTSLEPKEDTKMVYMRASMAIGMSSPMDKYHGRVKAAIIIREKLSLLCYNLNSRTFILVSTDTGFPLSRADELGRLIERLDLS